MDLDPQSGKLLDPEPDSNVCVSTVLNYLNADPDPTLVIKFLKL